MQQALYPKPIDDNCPYCGSENVTNNMDDCQPTASGCSVQVDCNDCGKSHHLNYQVATITLEDDAETPNLTDYIVGHEIPDMSQEGEENQQHTIIGAVQARDGLFIMAAGYGDGASARGYGCPVIIEMYEGELRVITWDDINNDDAGPIVPLGGAKHELENMMEGHPFRVQVLTPDHKIIESHDFEQLHSGAIKYAEEFQLPARHRIKVFDIRNNELHHERK